jgi:uncharacterized protein (TIGR00255 family)
MTGVGRAEASLARKKTKLIVEIRSANHKFIETNIKLPNALSGYENKIRELINDKIFRGSLQISISIHGVNGEINQNSLKYNRTLSLDYELLSNLINLTKQLKKNYKITGELDINTVLVYPGMIVSVKSDEADKKNIIWLKTKQTINKALSTLNKMKKEEGAFLYKDFTRRIQSIAVHLKSIERRSRTIRKELHAKAAANNRNHRQISLEQSMQIELLNSSRATTEEVVRLASHIRSFLRTIRTPKIKSVGRKLEFILAEMLREIETILAKGRDTSISQNGIQIKEEIDALREQVRNVE